MILKSDDWLFVSTMKCATNSLYKVLPAHGGQWIGGQSFHALPKPEERLAPTHWTCCRNPYDRAVSIWASTCVRKANRERYGAFGYIQDFGGDPLSFADFARYILPARPKLGPTAWLWRNQSDWQDQFIVDLVLRTEELETELLWYFGIDARIPFLNASQHEQWRHYYGDGAVVAAVDKWAGEDFDRFAYDRLDGRDAA